MDRYVLVVFFCRSEDNLHDSLTPVQNIYEKLVDRSLEENTLFPACSLSGNPANQKCFFAVQACQGLSQFCSSEWEELSGCHQKTDSEEDTPTALEQCISCLCDQELLDHKVDDATLTELLDEAAEGLHLLSDKLPPPGKALLDILMVGSSAQPPATNELLPLLGALKHMSCWHNAQITVVTQNPSEWQKVASYLSAGLVEPTALDSCVDHRQMWRGGLVIREKQSVSELRFDGFSLRSPLHPESRSKLLTPAENKLNAELFHFYAPVLELQQLVSLSDLPNFIMSSTTFELCLSRKSSKSAMFLEQLRTLRGKVGALFSLSCTVTPIVQPSVNQLSSQRWREFLAAGPKSLSVPETEVKGESSHYLLLVQGANDLSGVCTVRMLNSDNQLNGAAAMATVTALLREPSAPMTGETKSKMVCLLPRLHGDYVLRRERKLAKVQTHITKEYIKRRVGRSESAAVPISELKALLNLSRERCLKLIDSSLPSISSALTDDRAATALNSDFRTGSLQQTDWPERSVLQNIENLQKRKQKKRIGLLVSNSSDSLLGPKDTQKSSVALLDAKELLRHFAADGMPAGELQPLALNRGNNVFQLSPDLSPGKVRRMSFSKASATHYHGIEFCLDNQRSLDKDQSFVRLQSRLIRFETQTTCSKEPGALPFALSPAPSPSVMSEPGSVHDGETLQNADVARLKRRSNTESVGGYRSKRLVKSESSDSLCSQSSGSSGTHPSIRSLRRQTCRSQSTSLALTSSAARGSTSDAISTTSTEKPQQKPHPQTEDKASRESRSQKHNRMLQEVVAKTLKHHGISSEHKCFEACSKRLFDISKFYLKDLKTSRGLHEEMKKAAGSNVRQVIDWVLEKHSKK